ncbi:MAG: M16 family metallopeptidase, partial [Acidobacteriota bacterium]
MKTRSLKAIFASVLLALAALAPAQVKKVDEISYPKLHEFEVPEAKRVVLDNGMVVMLIEDHELPLVSVVARVRTGSRLEPADRIGLASLTGSVMRTGGTTKISGDQLDDFLESRAANISTSIGESFGSASMNCLKQDFADVLPVFADILRNPAFEEDKIKIAKNQVVAG